MGGIDSPTDTDLLLATYKGGSHLTSDIQNGGTIMIKVNAIGDACPIPVVKTKNAIRELQGGGTVETLVDNEIAVQNLTKMANQKGYDVHSEKVTDNGFTPIFIVSEFLKNEDPFECSWDVTSDSIAAYVAHSLNAKLLIVTNVNGIYTREPNEEGSEFINVIDAKKLLTFDETSIDLMLPSLLLKFGSDCFVVNGKLSLIHI